MRIKWKVGEAPTGRFRSFQHRSWPSAEYPSGELAGYIGCEDSYKFSLVETGRHSPLNVYVSVYSGKQHKNFRFKRQFATLAEAKAALEAFIVSHPEIRPDHQPNEGI